MPEFDEGVRLWLIDLREVGEEIALLDVEECERAARLVREQDRERFIRAHCALRRTLAANIGAEPKAIVFGQDANGKPLLAGRSSPSFNLSHSGDYALIGIADRCIGVDVEVERPFDIEEVAQLALSSVELRSFRSLPPADIACAFFDLWTRKEALLKAGGLGLRFDLRNVDLGIDQENAAVQHEGHDWTVRRIVTRNPGVHAAIAVEGVLRNVPSLESLADVVDEASRPG